MRLVSRIESGINKCAFQLSFKTSYTVRLPGVELLHTLLCPGVE